MVTQTRMMAAALLASAAMAGSLLAQGAAGPAPAGAPPATQAPDAGGRGRQAGPGGQGGGGRRGGFTQFTRELAPQDVLVRGRSLYEGNCASCHMADLRGSATSPNLLRSAVALNDQKGEQIAAAVARHTPGLNLVANDMLAVAEYIHSVHATMGGQGGPPGARGASGAALNILVGDAKSGETLFGSLCASCHSVTGDLKGAGTRYGDARALQNAWVAGQGGTFGGGGRGGGGGAGNPVTVTMADGSTLKGTLVRRDEFLVVLTLPDGTRKSIARSNGIPKVEVTDPQAAHKAMALKLIFDDPDNKKMHDITAYLATLK